MNPSFHEPTQHEDDDSLPEVSYLEDDLSLDNLTGEDAHEAHVEGAQDALDDEPEGIFALFDSEFRSREMKMPLNPEEKSKFGEEFLQGFDDMFDSVEGGEDLPFLSEATSNSSVGNFGRPLSNASSTENLTSERDEDEDEEEPLLEPGGMYQAEEDSDMDEPLPDGFLSLNDYPEEESLEDPLPMDLGDDSDDDSAESLDTDWSNFDAEFASEEDDELPQVEIEELASDEPDANTDNDSDDFFSDGADWNPELEEISFDDEQEDPAEDEVLLSDEDDEELFDEFTRLALGDEDDDSDDEEDEDEEDDFVIADISDTDAEPDPFEEIAIMSSEEVSEYTPSFGEEELKFEDDLPNTEDEDEDPFAMPSDGKKEKKGPQDEDESLEIDPFGDEAQSLQNQESDEKDESDDKQDKNDNDDSKRDSNSKGLISKLISLLLVPWNIYSKLTGLAFNLLNGALRAIGGLPIVGFPFNLLANVLSAIPMFAKKIILLAFIGGVFSGVSLVIPSPSSSIELPDYGEAKFSGVELKDGVVTGTVENKGDVIVSVYPTVEVSERKLLEIGSWFSPNPLGECTGDILEVAIDNSAEVSFNCDIVSDGSLKIKPSLKE